MNDIIKLAEKSSDEEIRDLVPAKIDEVKKIFDKLENSKPVKSAKEPPAPPPPAPPAPPPPPKAMIPKPLKLKGINVSKNNGVELRLAKSPTGGSQQGADLINELKNAFKTKLRRRGSVRKSLKLERESLQRNLIV